ncbi:hypothetical protein BKA65DRAFT_15226 [Rhexocercosporidium sp. MPI-PUGE-AT-0058]|nr:hypothetical protein BKA65DRAFT_15226 [Rhexocercosporidium sp. MPI-PUGE-AT-0058]
MNQRTKVKRCSTCAARKIACDLKSPACSQCLLTGRECPGYHRDYIFLQQTVATSRSNDGRRKSTALRTFRKNFEKARPHKASSGLSRQRTSQHSAVKYTISNIATGTKSSDDVLIQVIIENFAPSHEISLVHVGDHSPVSLNSRMCGAWVTLLPELFAKSATGAGVLCIGARALGTAISGRLREDESLISESLELVCRGLKALREVLNSHEEVPDVEVLSASMCLKITEVLLGTSHNGWSVHIQGIAELVKDRGPSCFATGTAHQLFTSFRIFMLLEFIQKRKSIFLANHKWLNIPFSVKPKSSMQTLLDAASALPGILEKLDELHANQCVMEGSTVPELLAALDFILQDLRKWEAEIMSDHKGPLWWPVSSSSPTMNVADEETVFPISYQFANILTANTMCHYWAFLAITLSSTTLLKPPIPSPLSTSQSNNFPASNPVRHSFCPEIHEELLALSSNICASMPYHMHPSQKFYGPASTFFPLWIALQIFERDVSPQSKMKEMWCRNLLRELEERGLPLAKHLPGCRPGIWNGIN